MNLAYQMDAGCRILQDWKFLVQEIGHSLAL